MTAGEKQTVKLTLYPESARGVPEGLRTEPKLLLYSPSFVFFGRRTRQMVRFSVFS